MGSNETEASRAGYIQGAFGIDKTILFVQLRCCPNLRVTTNGDQGWA
jgi:hypothetical protein